MEARTLTPGEYVGTFLGSLGLGAVLTEMIRKVRSKEDKAAILAIAARDTKQGEAAIIAVLTDAFTDTTGGLRHEIERIRTDAVVLRDRAVSLEQELRAALQKLSELDRNNIDLKAQLIHTQDDVVRLRGERDVAVERIVQQEGEIRQLNTIIEINARNECKHDDHQQ